MIAKCFCTYSEHIIYIWALISKARFYLQVATLTCTRPFSMKLLLEQAPYSILHLLSTRLDKPEMKQNLGVLYLAQMKLIINSYPFDIREDQGE